MIKRCQNKDYYAVVDLGSNSFHLVIWHYNGLYFEEMTSNRQLVQIAYGLLEDGTLTAEKEADVLAVLAQFKQETADIPIKQIKAVGTQVFRKISDPDFLSKAETALGYPIEIISGDEEAILIYQGVSYFSQSHFPHIFVIDIGGASSEFILGNQQTILKETSLDVGCVTATRTYFSDGIVTSERYDQARLALQDQLREQLDKEWFTGYSRDELHYIGASGTIRTVTHLLTQLGRGSDNALTIKDVDALIKELIRLRRINTIEKRFNLTPQTASILPAGVLLIEQIFKHLEIEQLEITHASLREGILLNLAL